MDAAASSFFVTGGTLRQDAPCYLARQADQELLAGLDRGEFCYVLTSRQMGKSSLMVRTAGVLRQRGAHVVVLDLTAVGLNVTPEQWYDGLLMRLGEQLQLDDELDVFWQTQTRYSPVQRFFLALRNVVMEQRPGRLVIFVDEIDTVRSLDFKTDEFFAAVRECYNRRTEDAEFNRLTFCLLGVATPSDLMEDTRLTPFNIGQRIELRDFTADEVQGLAAGLPQTPRIARALLRRVLAWTNGHPYLTQRLCQAVAENAGLHRAHQVDRVCQSLFLNDRARDQDANLLFVRDRLLRFEPHQAALLTLYAKVRRGREPVLEDPANPLMGVLQLTGIVRRVGRHLRVRNRIYERVFDAHWIEENMPDAELRRQREAFRRGAFRVAGVSAVLVAIFATLGVIAWQQARLARDAYAKLARVSVEAFISQARSGRLRGLAGQRFAGLDALAQAARIEPSPRLRDEAIACLALPDIRVGRQWAGFPPGTSALAFDHNLNQYARSDATGSLTVHRVADDEVLAQLPGSGTPAARLWFSPQATHLAAAYPGAEQRDVIVWNLQTRQPVAQWTNVLNQDALAFTADNQFLAVGDAAGQLRMLNLTSGVVRAAMSLPVPPVTMQFNPDGRHLAALAALSLSVDVYDLPANQVIKPVLYGGGIMRSLNWSADGRWLAAGCDNGRVYVFDRQRGTHLELEGHLDRPMQLAFSRSGRFLASVGADNTLRLWAPQQSTRPLVTWEGALHVPQLQFGPRDRTLAANLVHENVGLWQIETSREFRRHVDEQSLGPGHLAISPTGRLVASAHGGGITLWDIEAGDKLALMSVGAAYAVAFHPASGDLVASDLPGINWFPVVPTHQETSTLLQVGPGHNTDLPVGARQLAYARDGTALALLWKNRVALVDARKFKPKWEQTDTNGFSALALSPRANWVAVARREGGVQVWETATNRLVTTLPLAGAIQLAFDPSGQWLAISSEALLGFWRTDTWRLHQRVLLNAAEPRPPCLAFAPDGRLLAFPTSERVLDLIQPDNGVRVARLEAPLAEHIADVQFLPDGARLVVATESKTIQVWDLARLRRGLAALDLDWDLPAYSLAPAGDRLPYSVTVKLGDFDKARENPRSKLERTRDDLTRRIQENPLDWRFWLHRAYVRMDLKEYAESAEDWKQCLLLQPNNTWALRDLAWIYLFGPTSLRNFPEARKLANKAVRLEPDNADNQYRLGVAYLRTGKYTQCTNHLARAWELEIGKPSPALRIYIEVHQAMCLGKMGQLAAGKAALRHALNMIDADPDRVPDRDRLDGYIREAQNILGQ